MIYSSILTHLRSLSGLNDFTILGDLNLPDVCQDSYYGISNQSQQFADLAYDLNLSQLVSNSTHKASNLLDVILTNTEVFYDIQTLPNFPSGLYSDHLIIVFSTNTQIQKVYTSSKLVFNYAAADWDSMNLYLSHYNYYPCLLSQDVEFIWDYIKTAIHNASNLYIPKSRSKAQRQPTWFNSSIRHQLHCIHTLRWKHTKQPTTSNKIKLDTAEHELQQLMIQEKANYV